jgi:hypothetical protein
MSLIAKETQSYDPIPEGMHHAICYALYDLGHQYSEKFKKSIHQLIISWELPEVRISIEVDGEQKDLPRSISRSYSLSLGKKSNLRRDLQSWRGKSFTEDELKGWDISKILKVNALIQVIHKTRDDNTFSEISAITPLMKGMQGSSPENPVKLFVFGDSKSIPEGTPEWISKKIQESEEWKTAGIEEAPPPPEWMDQANPPAESSGDDKTPF